jgi:DNA-binding transcriptional LysR family regulator
MLKIAKLMCINAQLVVIMRGFFSANSRGVEYYLDTNWNDIRFFLSVSRTNSFLSAAQQLQVTHSTVSRRISALEDSLQTKLFIRTERGCSLTASGEKLLPLAERLERAALKFQEHILPSESALSGRIRIGTPDGLGNCFLACELNTLQLRYPQLEVELVSVPLYYSLYKREVDILITVQRPTTRKVVAEKIINYRLGFFASQSYLDRSDSI